MKIEKFVLGPMGTNCYIAVNEENEECFFVDPAAWPPELSSHIRTGGEKPLAVLLTHGHFDHIMGLDGLLKEYDIPVYALENEKDILNSGRLNLSAMMGTEYTFSGARYVKDGQILDLGGMQVRVIHTPGHTSGGLYRKGRRSLQWRYTVPRVNRQNGFSYGKQQPACPFSKRKAV